MVVEGRSKDEACAQPAPVRVVSVRGRGAWWCGRGVCAQPALNPPLWARLSREARGVRLYLGLLWAALARGFPGLNQAQSTPLSEAHLEPPRTGVLYYIEQMDFLLLLLREQCHAASLRMGILGELIEAESALAFVFLRP